MQIKKPDSGGDGSRDEDEDEDEEEPFCTFEVVFRFRMWYCWVPPEKH
jgi:hypothetical protein